jgi:hypothetical protein
MLFDEILERGLNSDYEQRQKNLRVPAI